MRISRKERGSGTVYCCVDLQAERRDKHGRIHRLHDNSRKIMHLSCRSSFLLKSQPCHAKEEKTSCSGAEENKTKILYRFEDVSYDTSWVSAAERDSENSIRVTDNKAKKKNREETKKDWYHQTPDSSNRSAGNKSVGVFNTEKRPEEVRGYSTKGGGEREVTGGRGGGAK